MTQHDNIDDVREPDIFEDLPKGELIRWKYQKLKDLIEHLAHQNLWLRLESFLTQLIDEVDEIKEVSQQKLRQKLGTKLTRLIEKSICQIKQISHIDSLRKELFTSLIDRLIRKIQSLPKDEEPNNIRRKLVVNLISAMMASGRITTNFPWLPTPLYPDAFQDAMGWFLKNIDRYDPAKSKPLTWFNRILKYKSLDLVNRRTPLPIDPHKIDIPDESAHHELDFMERSQCVEKLQAWVKEDPENKLRRIAMRDGTHSQNLIDDVLFHYYQLRDRDNPTTKYQGPAKLTKILENLACLYGCNPNTLRKFWSNKCIPIIQKFCNEHCEGSCDW